MHSTRCKEQAQGFNTEEKVRLCICRDDIHVQFCICSPHHGDFSQEERLRRSFHRQLKRDRENEWTSRAKEFEKETRTREKPILC
ncbi:hypothetical protein RB195_011937 [Necator americanus]|uniref:Uncharacterized protein n=1 Tax=Necator americanus TaxID=51031 RepID=A0ABR1D4T1_NECAM